MQKTFTKRIISQIMLVVFLLFSFNQEFNVIYSYAEEINYSEQVLKIGDMNNDSVIDIFDAIRAKRAVLEEQEQSFNIADINCDGKFSILDEQLIEDYILMRDLSGNINVGTTDKNNNYRYAVFSSDKNSSLTIDSSAVTINGILGSNGDIEINSDIGGDYTVADNANISVVYMNDKITQKFFENAEEYDEFIVDEEEDDVNLILDSSISSLDNIIINKKLTFKDACMMSVNDIEINSDASNEGNTILYSKYGDISLKEDNINIVGLIYAPFGTVKLSAKSIQIDGIIIAKCVIIDAEDQVNIHTNTSMAEFIGVDTEEMIIPYSDWDYIDKPEDSAFAEIVEEQIYDDPLSVDDAWLEDYYGEEIVSEYGEDNKQQLVEALYMGQKDNISNYHDIITFLDYCRKIGFLSAIRLKTKLSKTNPEDNALSIFIGDYEISAEKAEISNDDIPQPGDPDFVGPVRPYGPYKWNFYIYADDDSKDDDDNDNKDPSSDEKTDKKKFQIFDIPATTFLIGCGATIKEATGAAIGEVAGLGAGLAGTISSLKNDILDDIEKAKIKTLDKADKVAEIAKNRLNETLVSIGDTEFFKVTQRKLENGFSFDLGGLSLKLSCTEEGWNFSSNLDAEELKLDKIENVVDIGTIKDINSVSPTIYKEIATDIMTGNVPSNLLDILDCIRNDTDKYKVAYSKLKNIEKAYKSVTFYNTHLNEYASDSVKYSVKLTKTYSDSKKNSKILREELYKSGVTYHKYFNCAHHVVPHDMDAAQEARDILEAYGIDLNSAANGVLLPGHDDDYVVYESFHPGGHTKTYCTNINKRLSDVLELNEGKSYNEIQRALCDELTKIKIDLFSGVITVND